MFIEISDAMFAKLDRLASAPTWDETDGQYDTDYEDGVDDGQIILAREFLDEAVIIRD